MNANVKPNINTSTPSTKKVSNFLKNIEIGLHQNRHQVDNAVYIVYADLNLTGGPFMTSSYFVSIIPLYNFLKCYVPSTNLWALTKEFNIRSELSFV
jgi:hypothetical protein